ncbi:hypothetical protein C4588_04170 [Candidatus Parcubacteria bacterium]|nr:MAG: hypothetical protein C4588_04170 [Candidatus Parcubacteria bacterium]
MPQYLIWDRTITMIAQGEEIYPVRNGLVEIPINLAQELQTMNVQLAETPEVENIENIDGLHNTGERKTGSRRKRNSG